MKVMYEEKSTLENRWDQEWDRYSVRRTLEWNRHHELIAVYDKYLPKTGRILEGGCGLGRLVIHYKRKGYDIVGIESSEVAVKKVSQFDASLPVEMGDLENLGFEDDSFEAYISAGVIEHYEDGPWKVLSEAKRVLKKDGLLLINVPILNPVNKVTISLSKCNLMRRVFGKKVIDNNDSVFESYLYTRDEFKSIIRQSGFRIDDCIPTLHAAGLYRVFPFLRNKNAADDFDILGHTDGCLNRAGRLFLRIFRKRARWLFPTGALCIARRR